MTKKTMVIIIVIFLIGFLTGILIGRWIGYPVPAAPTGTEMTPTQPAVEKPTATLTPTIFPTSIITTEPMVTGAVTPALTSVPELTATTVPVMTITDVPVLAITVMPTQAAVEKPTATLTPTIFPTSTMTTEPMVTRTVTPAMPTQPETGVPTVIPTQPEAGIPTATPTQPETGVPTAMPTQPETGVPTAVPTQPEAGVPTAMPTQSETDIPTAVPTQSEAAVPTLTSTPVPTAVHTPLLTPTLLPTPTLTSKPTPLPTPLPGDNSADVSASGYYGALHVEGAHLVDEKGNIAQLRGISTHGLGWFPQYVNAEAITQFKEEWGCNVFRLAMYTAEWNGYCTSGEEQKRNLKKIVDLGVQAATDADMYVIIDWHVLNDRNPNTYKEEAKKFFAEAAEKYAGNPHVLYEICNEPNSGVSWSEVRNYALEVIPVIRKYDADAVIIVGTPTWSQDVDMAAANPITEYENLVYALHFYAATHQESLRDKCRQAADAGLPLFVSEYGICDASGNGALNTAQADLWISLLDSYGISYVAWNLSNKAESSSLLKSSCNKINGFTESDLSDSGKWLVKMLHTAGLGSGVPADRVAGGTQNGSNAGNEQSGHTASGSSQNSNNAGNEQGGHTASGGSQNGSNAGNEQSGHTASGGSQNSSNAGNEQGGHTASGGSQNDSNIGNTNGSATSAPVQNDIVDYTAYVSGLFVNVEGLLLSCSNGWQTENGISVQLAVAVQNTGASEESGWVRRLVPRSGVTVAVSQIWCAKVSEEDGVLVLTPEEYNKTVPASGTVEGIGMILEITGH